MMLYNQVPDAVEEHGKIQMVYGSSEDMEKHQTAI